MASASGDAGVTTTQRLPAPLAEPGAPIAPLDGSTLVLTPVGRRCTHARSGGCRTSAMFDQRLTRTGAMMGTPAYMAPEQFRGHATDARTDQFAFCIALYEALYGERPFAGNTLMALTTNVVNGKVREAPANTKVPLWIRKILLRGLRVNADERWASMEELIEALGKNPAVKRRKVAGIVLSALAIARSSLSASVRASRIRAPSAAAGRRSSRASGSWSAPATRRHRARRALHEAFLKTGKSYAKDVWATTSRALTNYARAWADMYRQTCEATDGAQGAVGGGDRSAHVVPRRTPGRVTRVDGRVRRRDTARSSRTRSAPSNALASLDRCADVPLLRAVVRPPEDAATRKKVGELRKRLADLKARFDSGGWRTVTSEGTSLVVASASVGYQPLMAESLALVGNAHLKINNPDQAEQNLVEAFWAAEASRHDEVRAEVAANLLYVVGYLQGRFAEAHRWGKTAQAILARLGGHELLQAWLLNDLGCVFELEGRRRDATQAHERSLALKEKVLAANDPDVGISEINLAIAFQESRRPDEALLHINRAIRLLRNGLGSDHPDLALAMMNGGEILNALHRYREARESFGQARIIWERELGAESVYLGFALTGIGVSYLAEGPPESALPHLERALEIRDSQEKDAARRAETRFALARALWNSKRDRPRAYALALEAKKEYGGATAAKDRLMEVEEWLRDRSSAMAVAVSRVNPAHRHPDASGAP